MKELVAELSLENRLLKKNMIRQPPDCPKRWGHPTVDCVPLLPGASACRGEGGYFEYLSIKARASFSSAVPSMPCPFISLSQRSKTGIDAFRIFATSSGAIL